MPRTFTIQDQTTISEQHGTQEQAAQAAADALGLPCGALLLEIDDEGEAVSAWKRSGLTGQVIRVALED